LQKIAASFLHELPTNGFTNGGLRVYSDRISRCNFFASCGTTDCFANGGLRCIQRGIAGCCFIASWAGTFSSISNFKHWRVFNLTTYMFFSQYIIYYVLSIFE
jgi:hypothetical protein